jgi:uncharacterized protein
MLMRLGTVEFDVFPFNTHEYSRDAATDYAKKAVVGAREILEYVGEGEEKYTISGKLITKRLGGLGTLAELHALRQSGIAQFLMRGDGMALGWFVIESVGGSVRPLAVRKPVRMKVLAETVTVSGDGVTIDLLVWRKFRRPMPGLVEKILDTNFGLAKLGPILPLGTVVTIPETELNPLRRDPATILLWD